MKVGDLVYISRWNGDPVDEWAVVDRPCDGRPDHFDFTVLISERHSSAVSVGVGRHGVFDKSFGSGGASYRVLQDHELSDRLLVALAAYQLTGEP